MIYSLIMFLAAYASLPFALSLSNSVALILIDVSVIQYKFFTSIIRLCMHLVLVPEMFVVLGKLLWIFFGGCLMSSFSDPTLGLDVGGGLRFAIWELQQSRILQRPYEPYTIHWLSGIV